MTIKVVAVENSELRLKCFQCSADELSHSINRQYKWNNFNVETGNKSDLATTCLSCGHSYPRKQLIFAKYKDRDKIHLCVCWDGYSLTSRCGSFTGNLLDDRCIELEGILAPDTPCESCALAEGVASYNKDWLTDKDNAKELEFYRCL